MYHDDRVQISQKEIPQRNIQDKARCWQDLVDEVKLVTRKIGALQKLCSLKAEQMDRIVRALFSAHPVRDDDVGAESAVNYPLFSIKELEQANLSMKSNKASTPDGISEEVLAKEKVLGFEITLVLLLIRK